MTPEKYIKIAKKAYKAHRDAHEKKPEKNENQIRDEAATAFFEREGRQVKAGQLETGKTYFTRVGLDGFRAFVMPNGEQTTHDRDNIHIKDLKQYEVISMGVKGDQIPDEIEGERVTESLLLDYISFEFLGVYEAKKESRIRDLVEKELDRRY
jgi:hypothetical protein